MKYNYKMQMILLQRWSAPSLCAGFLWESCSPPCPSFAPSWSSPRSRSQCWCWSAPPWSYPPRRSRGELVVISTMMLWCSEGTKETDSHLLILSESGDSMDRLKFCMHAVLKIWARFGLCHLRLSRRTMLPNTETEMSNNSVASEIKTCQRDHWKVEENFR